MTKDNYERIILNITEFDKDDVIATSGESPVPTPGQTSTKGNFGLDKNEMFVPF